MAPSRKKGGGKAAAAAASVRRQWKVGDLVLAKVKGFPAWPAAVSEPEQWGYPADWKKVLVHFFGTQQIAFCNPVDVESFTEEKKQSLLTKRHAKGSDFVRAVKEITESYEKLKQKDRADGPKSAEEITVGRSFGNTVELPQACENLIGTRLDTRDESTLLSEDASAAEQMLALRHHTLDRNGACDSAVANDLCEIATYSSRRRNEKGWSQKCVPQKIIVPVQRSKISSRFDVDRLQSSMLQCNDGGQSVDGIYDGAIRRRKRVRRSGHSVSDGVVSSFLNLHGSDEDNASEIATVESENNSRNEGNGVDSGSKVEHSDASEGCEGGHELNKGLDFQISTMVKRKKRKPTRKRETSDLIDPPAKVEVEEVLEAKACDRSESSHERLNERPCEKNGDEHLPLAKRARVRMSRAFYADENVNASSQFEERLSKDTLVSAPEQTSPSVNHENDIVSGHDTSAAEELNSLEFSAKLSGDMVDVVLSHTDKPSDRMSPSRACVQTVGDKQSGIEFHENEFSLRPDDEVTRALSNQRSSSLGEKARVPEVVERCSEESQTRNCLISESDPIDMQCSPQSEKNKTLLNPDSSADKAPGLDMRASWVPAQSAHQHQSQENDYLITVGDSLNEKCEKIDCHMTEVVQAQAVERSPLLCSVVNNQEETEKIVLKEEQGSPVKEQAHMIQNPVLSATESDMIVEEAEPQRETVHSCHCEDAVENKEPEKSEKKVMSDDVTVTQVKKVVSSDLEFTIESFETALGSLVRTKETIGRATRLAMDLVKFGASAKAMEILAHTLESESNLQRRVDLFFLVDSIAQCSKGLNGDVYLSSIEVMLPRLLSAAVPAGATTEENRKQCLKVLRLWLERRILPESIIRHHIRELDSQACLYSRRSARTERALDDPVRDMEGMLVDEYGSNSTLQFITGFCIEDGDGDGDGGFESVTPEHESVTERRHTRILEDVDGELEMEDVAPHQNVKSMPRGEVSYNRPSYYYSSRREGSLSTYPPHRSHYMSEFDERKYYYYDHERMRHEDRENWRYHHHHHHPPSHGPRYHDRYKGPYNGYNHHHQHHQYRDSGRYQNQRWSHSPRGYNNNRHSSFHYKPHSEGGPVPVGIRDPGSWHQR